MNAYNLQKTFSNKTQDRYYLRQIDSSIVFVSSISFFLKNGVFFIVIYYSLMITDGYITDLDIDLTPQITVSFYILINNIVICIEI